MKVLVADKLESHAIKELGSLGCEVTYEPDLSGDALAKAISRTACTVLMVRSTRVNEAALTAGGELSLVVRAGAGVNTIDVNAASRRSILVANCPGKNAVAVAELTLALILALDRRLVENANDLRKGVWNKKEYAKARGLKGRCLGIIGMGQIGQAVACRALAFDMRVAAWSRSLTHEQAADYCVDRYESPVEVASQCSILSLHLAATPETKGIISAEVLDRLAPDSYLINTSRAEVLDYKALASAVADRGLRVGLDVFENEPGAGDSTFSDAIVKAGGVVYGTHHIGASTDQAQAAIAAEAVRIVRLFFETGDVINCVNLRGTSPATWCIRVRHRNEPGVLAHVLSELSFAGINVEEMENVITQSAETACAQIKLDAEPAVDVVNRIREGHSAILGVMLTQSDRT